tara:strand:- start:57 stop:257 length:201 start_codon:yes stop_codon:yes gene_type:complete
MSYKDKLEEIESFLSSRKRQYQKDIGFYIRRKENGEADEADLIYLQMAESGILFVEEMGNTFFNWE